MFGLAELELPLIGAPMAGAPSTPALAAAVTNVGGLGFLAAGNRSATALADDVAQTRVLTPGPFGVNVFVPDHANTAADLPDPQRRREAVNAYRNFLAPEFVAAGMAAPPVDADDDDGWGAKLDLLHELGVPVVSFTFGLPPAAVITSLQGAGSAVMITVTDPGEAAAAMRNGADLLCVQGPLAGGHRSTHSLLRTPADTPLIDLVRRIATESSVPLIAAGGIATAGDVVELLHAGAAAVQVGTLLLRCPESGAPAVHKDALADPSFTDTTVTRAFSGRWARGLSNNFIRQYSEHAPAAYPELNQLTKPLRSAAAKAGNRQQASLWAGPQFASAADCPAADVVRTLFEP